MSKIVKFGEDVKGYEIPVLNEREIRAGAGILFVLMFVAINQAASKGDFTLLKYAILIFLFDMLIRVIINPRFSPVLIIGRLIVRKQTPEYVGAKQKKFAWIIGVALGVIMLVHLIIFNAQGPVTGLICMVCLIFLFFESAFGICIGCKFYQWIYREKAQYCPGEVCDIKSRHDIQKTSLPQLLIVAGFIVYIVLSVLLLNESFKKQPYNLFGIEHGKEVSDKINSSINTELGALSVSLRVKDIAVSKEFYEKLGFEVSGGEEKQNWLIMRSGDHVIGLFEGMLESNLITFNPGWDQKCNTLESFKGVKDIKEELRGKGIRIEMESEETKTGGGSFFVTDPDGNRILFDQHV